MPKLLFSLLVIASSTAFAYIPPTKMILSRLADNSGSGTYTIEQEVQISTGLDPIYLKESWIVENERTLHLTVTGEKELKDLVKLQFIYVGGQKWQLKNGKREALKIPDEFIERYFHIRNSENLLAYLQALKILPPMAGTKKTIIRKGEESRYEPEPYVRLGRTEGTINYVFGQPTAPDQKDNNPGLWVEQDQFVIRKLRFPSQVEVTAENHGNFSRSLTFPKLRTVQWNQNTVYLRVLSISGKNPLGKKAFQTTNLTTPVTINNLPNPVAQSVIEEFYTRFR